MNRPLMTGAAFGVIAFLAPQVASAQCEKRLTEAAGAISTLPDAVDRRVHDRLNELYAEAEEAMGGNEPACVATVQRMEEMIRQNGGAAGSASSRRSAPSTPSVSAAGAATATATTAAEAAGSASPDVPRPGVIPFRAPASTGQALESRVAPLPPTRQAEVRDLDDYMEALRGFGVKMAQDMASAPPARINEVVTVTNDSLEAAELLTEVLINEPMDQDHAALEDASRDVEHTSQRVEQMQREYEAAKRASDTERGDRLQAEYEQARQAGDHQRAVDLAHQLDAERDRTDAAADRATELANRLDPILDRLDAARGRVRRITDRINRRLAGDLGPEYRAAFAKLEAKHQQENRALDAQCEARRVTANQELARDYLQGNRESNAIGAAIADCKAISTPVWERQQREWDELEAHFAITNDRPARSQRGPSRTPQSGTRGSTQGTTTQGPSGGSASSATGQTSSEEPKPTQEPARDRATLEAEVARAERRLRDAERLAASPDAANDPFMAGELEIARTQLQEARGELHTLLIETDPAEYQRRTSEIARAEERSAAARELRTLEQDAARAERRLRDAERLAASPDAANDPFMQGELDAARNTVQETRNRLETRRASMPDAK